MAYMVKQRLLSLDEQDPDGSEFTVQYIGAVQMKEKFDNTGDVLDEFVQNTTGQSRKYSTSRFVVAQRGAVLYDNEGAILHSFVLCDISDVLYSSEYSKHFVLIGKESCVSSCVKAHVFVCENKANARRLYQTFIEIFQLALQVTSKKEIILRNNPDETLTGYIGSPRDFFRAEETGIDLNSNYYTGKQFPKPNTGSLPNSLRLEALDSERNSDVDYFEQAFTEFAQSRSGFGDLLVAG